jgi:hypothetical protein
VLASFDANARGVGGGADDSLDGDFTMDPRLTGQTGECIPTPGLRDHAFRFAPR